MRIVTLALFLFMTFSCSQKGTDKRVVEFENLFGKKQIDALNLLVEDFDKNLNRIYPDLQMNQAYYQFLVAVKNKDNLDWNEYKFQSKNTASEFDNSGLKREIFTEENSQLAPNFAGKYSIALNKLKESDELINGYCEIRDAIGGTIPSHMFASEILSSNPDFDDYFYKRIVVLEFSY